MMAHIFPTLARGVALIRGLRPVVVAARLGRLLIALTIGAHVLLFVVILGACLVLARANPPVTALILFRELTVHQKPRPMQFVPIRQIPASARQMFVKLEDMRFYTHPGIDLAAIRDAYLVNKSIGYALYGGSTIPQQLARTLFLTPRKTYLRKYVEALIALEMDLFLKKDRLLELYLNCIEWGKGIYGIGAASSYYFGGKPAALTTDELRRLVVILPNPLRYNVSTFTQSTQMAERYLYLLQRFPDPKALPQIGPAAEAEPVMGPLPAPEPAAGQ